MVNMNLKQTLQMSFMNVNQVCEVGATNVGAKKNPILVKVWDRPHRGKVLRALLTIGLIESQFFFKRSLAHSTKMISFLLMERAILFKRGGELFS